MEQAIGVDLGGTKIAAGLVTRKGKVLKKTRVETLAAEGPTQVIDRICQTIDEVIEDQPAGIGIGAPGQIDQKKGMVTYAPNLKWFDVDLKDIIEERYNLPVKIDNDIRCVTAAEAKFGAARDIDNVVVVFVGTGIGGGIIVEGRLLRGATNCAAEIGHMTIKEDGPLCGCGNYGCLESFASGPHIVEYVTERLPKWTDSSLFKTVKEGESHLDVSAIQRAAQEGDKLAVKALRRAAHYLGIGVANLVNILNPELIIFGGGVIMAAPQLLDLINESLNLMALPLARKDLKLIKSELGDKGGIIGASMLCWE